MTEPTITFTARRYRLCERLSGAWFMLFSNWGPSMIERLIYRLINARHVRLLYTFYLCARHGNRMRWYRKGYPI